MDGEERDAFDPVCRAVFHSVLVNAFGEFDFSHLVDGDTEVLDDGLVQLQIEANTDPDVALFEQVLHWSLCENFLGEAGDWYAAFFRILICILFFQNEFLSFTLYDYINA